MVNGTIKQVLVFRHDLKYRLGKKIAQGAHASGMFERLAWLEGIPPNSLQQQWIVEGQTKIVVRVDSETELFDIFKQAKQAGLTVHLITDAGLTEFKEPTNTCLAIGPNKTEDIDKITGHLKLL